MGPFSWSGTIKNGSGTKISPRGKDQDFRGRIWKKSRHRMSGPAPPPVFPFPPHGNAGPWAASSGNPLRVIALLGLDLRPELISACSNADLALQVTRRAYWRPRTKSSSRFLFLHGQCVVSPGLGYAQGGQGEGGGGRGHEGAEVGGGQRGGGPCGTRSTSSPTVRGPPVQRPDRLLAPPNSPHPPRPPTSLLPVGFLGASRGPLRALLGAILGTYGT